MRSRMLLRNEDGAVLIILAMVLLLLLGIAALVIDLAALRLDIRADRLAADIGATAGVSQLDLFAGSDAEKACNLAWKYTTENLGLSGVNPSPHPCEAFRGESCDPTTPPILAFGNVGEYGITITNPVPDGHALMGSQATDVDIDGSACQRMGVEITRMREYRFAQVLGIGSGSTTVSSVARQAVGTGGGELVPLVILDPHGCDVLYTSGQGGITVNYNNESPGIIVVDSDGTQPGANSPGCGNPNTWVIDVKGTNQGWIRAEDVPGGAQAAMLSYAIGTGNLAKAFDPNDLFTDTLNPHTGELVLRLFPEPEGIDTRITRAPIDHRYNCKASYASTPYLGLTIDGCLSPPAPYIDNLVVDYQPGNPTKTDTFQEYPRPGNPDDSCKREPSDGPVSLAAGNWWINCPDLPGQNGLTISGDDDGTPDFVFQGAGVIVFEGGVSLDSGGHMVVNASDTSPTTAFFRSGNFEKNSKGTLTMYQTFVYLHEGVISFGGNERPLVWNAPRSGNFEDLALWSESPDLHDLGGQGSLDLVGTIFTPFASPFRLTGQGDYVQTKAQFLTRRLEVAGQGEIAMAPDPDDITLIPVREVRLIR